MRARPAPPAVPSYTARLARGADEVAAAQRQGARLTVANHVSWLDILAVHGACPQARFIAMAEVQHWPAVPRLARAVGTIYLQRQRLRDLGRAVHEAAAALRAGDTVAVFPEGVVSDGHQLLKFHGNFLQAAIDAGVPVQPLALRYVDAKTAASDHASDAALFTGDITLGQSLWRLACAEGLELRIAVLPALAPPHRQRRRLMAAQLQAEVEAALGRAAA